MREEPDWSKDGDDASTNPWEQAAAERSTGNPFAQSSLKTTTTRGNDTTPLTAGGGGLELSNASVYVDDDDDSPLWRCCAGCNACCCSGGCTSQHGMLALCRRLVLQASLWCDVLVGFLLIIYGMVALQSAPSAAAPPPSNNSTGTTNSSTILQDYQLTAAASSAVSPALLISVSCWGVLLALRGILGLIGGKQNADSDDDRHCRCSLYMSLCTSPLAALVYLILCICVASSPHHVIAWFQAHQGQLYLPGWFVNDFVPKQFTLIWATFLALAVWECFRYKLLLHSHEFLVDEDEASPNIFDVGIINANDSMATTGTGISRRRPWWWRNSSNQRSPNAALSQALLEEHDNTHNGQPSWVSSTPGQYVERTGVGAETSTMTRLRRWFGGGSAAEDGNPRDDGSVDFASVQEEWERRSEQDPLWWSRDEENNNR